jgi:hypothetical protein
MKPGKSRFLNQITRIENLIQSANEQANPAKWLFLNDLRTPMFMLEGLSKLYSNINDELIFDQLKEEFKAVEDQLGAIDYFNAYHSEFLNNADISEELLTYFKVKTETEVNNLNQLLADKNWLDGNKISKIKAILDDIDWDKEEKETELLVKFYKKQIKKINEFVMETGLPFTDIELHVHELRRRIRWLSIYPQGLAGAVKLVEDDSIPNYLQKYLTDEVVNSKYNILPSDESQTNFVKIDKNKFLSLSWLIAELGKYKDKGLKINALKEACMEVERISDEEALLKTYEILGTEVVKIEDILQQTSQIIATFFEEENLSFILN